MSYDDYFWDKASKDVQKTKDFKEFIKLHPIFEKFGEYPEGKTWLERNYDAVKCRPDREIYCVRTLLLPKALTWNDLFSHAEIRWEKNKPRNDLIFCSFRDDELSIKNGWQGDKYYHLLVRPTEAVYKVYRDIIGYNITSFEIIKRDDEYLITIGDDSRIGHPWLAIIYDIPKNIEVIE